MLKKANITWSAKQVAKSINKGNVLFDNIVQRSYVWEKWRKSGLIHSMVFGYPIPPFYAAKSESGQYDMFDGQQRLLTISGFINDEWRLSDVPIVEYEEDITGEIVKYDMSGKKFSELPEEIKDIINSYSLTIYYYEDITQEEITEMFKRLNSGKPLSTKSKALASCQDLKDLIDLGNHNLFSEMLSDKSRANKNQVIITMKIWCMLNQDINEVSFESKKFNAMLENTVLDNYEKENIISVFDYIVSIHDKLVENKEKIIAKRLYTETHLVSLIPYIKQMMDNNVELTLASDFISYIFTTHNKAKATISDDYNEAALKGVAKASAIIARHNAIKIMYDEFFKKDKAMIEKSENNENTESNIKVIKSKNS